MNKHILWGVIALLFAQCSNQNTNPQAEETKSSNPNVVHLTDPQIKELGIALEPMKMDTIETTITLTGNLICPNQSQTQLSFPLSVQIEKILIQPGQMVQAGQTIATVSTPPISTTTQVPVSNGQQQQQTPLVNIPVSSLPLTTNTQVPVSLASLPGSIPTWALIVGAFLFYKAARQ